MTRTEQCRTVIMLATALVTITGVVRAQERRRAPTPGDGTRASPAGSPAMARFPYAGSWKGSLTMQGNAPGAGRPEQIVVTFTLTDSSKVLYSGTTAFGGGKGGGSPHLKSVVTDGVLHWEEKNSGPGFFVYSAHLVAPDSIIGTVKLRDGVLPGPPTGTFVLARLSPGATRSR